MCLHTSRFHARSQNYPQLPQKNPTESIYFVYTVKGYHLTCATLSVHIPSVSYQELEWCASFYVFKLGAVASRAKASSASGAAL